MKSMSDVLEKSILKRHRETENSGTVWDSSARQNLDAPAKPRRIMFLLKNGHQHSFRRVLFGPERSGGVKYPTWWSPKVVNEEI
jgi:hypothetical protein